MAQIEEMPHTQLPKLIYLRLGPLCMLHRECWVSAKQTLKARPSTCRSTDRALSTVDVWPQVWVPGRHCCYNT